MFIPDEEEETVASAPRADKMTDVKRDRERKDRMMQEGVPAGRD